MSRVAKIQRKIVCVMYVRNVWISKKIECPKLCKLIKKFCKLHVQNVWICRKIDYPELRKFNGKLCTFYTYGMSGFAEKLNILNCENWTGNCVHFMHGMSGLAKKLNIPCYIYSMGNCVHYICTECLDLQKNIISRTA